MQIVRCKPNGSCFYIAARLGIEVCEILKRIEADEDKPKTSCLDGFASNVLSSAEDLRKLICEWYHRGLESVVPQLGFQDEVSKVPFTRGDILALEVIRKGHDVPDKGPERLTCIRSLLDEMRRERSWASTPEQIALSTLTKCKVEVYNQSPSRMLVVRDTALPDKDGFKGTIKLLFDNSHQDLLISDEDLAKMVNWQPDLKNLPKAIPFAASHSLETFRPMVQTHGLPHLSGTTGVAGPSGLEPTESPV